MKVVKATVPGGRTALGLWEDEHIVPLSLAGGQFQSLAEIFESDNPAATIDFLADRTARPWPLADCTLLPPIDQQEVWAAGVTYRRSQVARMSESPQGASFYELVYTAARPELFLKATPNRVVGPNRPLRIRQDSLWSVPEPELAIVLNSRLDWVGFTIGNDMSARDIEGENPLYLPQAKTYDACCGLGPCITLAQAMPPAEQIGIHLTIYRRDKTVFHGRTSIASMARSFQELIDWLGRDNVFHSGVILLTGTGIVPEDSFRLKSGDVVEITIDGIGTLTNPIVQG